MSQASEFRVSLPGSHLASLPLLISACAIISNSVLGSTAIVACEENSGKAFGISAPRTPTDFARTPVSITPTSVRAIEDAVRAIHTNALRVVESLRSLGATSSDPLIQSLKKVCEQIEASGYLRDTPAAPAAQPLTPVNKASRMAPSMETGEGAAGSSGTEEEKYPIVPTPRFIHNMSLEEAQRQAKELLESFQA
ncbi:hypothetical protein PHISCL_09760, partial [Aspergillus sclerotialis]